MNRDSETEGRALRRTHDDGTLGLKRIDEVTPDHENTSKSAHRSPGR